MDFKELSLSAFLEIMAKGTPGDKPETRAIWLHQMAKARALENDGERLLEENKILQQELTELQQQGGFQ